MPRSRPVRVRAVPRGRSGEELGNLPRGSLCFLFLQVWASSAKSQLVLSYYCAYSEGGFCLVAPVPPCSPHPLVFSPVSS